MNLVLTLLSSCFEIYLNIILPSTPRSLTWFLLCLVFQRNSYDYKYQNGKQIKRFVLKLVQTCSVSFRCHTSLQPPRSQRLGTRNEELDLLLCYDCRGQDYRIRTVASGNTNLMWVVGFHMNLQALQMWYCHCLHLRATQREWERERLLRVRLMYEVMGFSALKVPDEGLQTQYFIT